MGFDFEKYQSGGNYVSGAEKKVLAENGIPFAITRVRETEKFDSEHFELSVLLPNPESGEEEERTLSFPKGSGADSRDSMLAAMKTHIEETGEQVAAKVKKIGRAYFLEAA